MENKLSGENKNINESDAVLITLKKRFNTSELPGDYQKAKDFYSFSHFTNISFDHIVNPATLGDLFIPDKSFYPEISFFEEQHLYLGRCVNIVHFFPNKNTSNGEKRTNYKYIDQPSNFFSKDDDFEEYPIFVITGLQISNKVKDKKVFEKDKQILPKFYFSEKEFSILFDLFKDTAIENDVKIEIREGLGFADYVFCFRAKFYQDILFLLMKIFNAQNESKTKSFPNINFVYSLPGTVPEQYNRVFLSFESEDSYENRKISSERFPIPNIDFKRHSRGMEFSILRTGNSNISESGFSDPSKVVFGEYDLINFNQFINQNEFENSLDASFKLFMQLTNDEISSIVKHKKNNFIVYEIYDIWAKYEEIKKAYESILQIINHHKSGIALSKLDLRKMELHIGLFHKVILQKQINCLLINEWGSNLSLFLDKILAILKRIENNLNDKSIFEEELRERHRNHINDLAISYEDCFAEIENSTSHWLTGGRNNIEYVTHDTHNHFGATTRIYTFYTKLFSELEMFFHEKSNNHEKINMLMVPTISKTSRSEMFFNQFNDDNEKIISIQLSSELWFSLNLLGIPFHEAFHYYAGDRKTRNKGFLNNVIESLSYGIYLHFFDSWQYDYLHFQQPARIQKSTMPDNWSSVLQYILSFLMGDKFSIPIDQALSVYIKEKINNYIDAKKIDIYNQYSLFMFKSELEQNIFNFGDEIDAKERGSNYQKLLTEISDAFVENAQGLYSKLRQFDEEIDKIIEESKSIEEFKTICLDNPRNNDILAHFNVCRVSTIDLIRNNFINDDDLLKRIVEDKLTDSEILQEIIEKHLDDFKKNEQITSQKISSLFTVPEVIADLYTAFYFESFSSIDEFKRGISNAMLEIHDRLSKSRLIPNLVQTKESLKNEINQLLTNKTFLHFTETHTFKSATSYYLNYFNEFIKECKADYLMCRSLGLTIDQYDQLFESNLSGSVSYTEHEFQKSERRNILEKANAFYDIPFNEDITRGDNDFDFYQKTAQILHDSLSSDINDLVSEEGRRKYPCIAACRDFMISANHTISDELQLINTVLHIAEKGEE